MRIGIYNRHLTGVGGGEKHMLAMAEVLSRRYPVEVLTPHLLDLEEAGAHLGLDLHRVRLRPLEDRPEPELAPITAEYDLFINATDGTFLPSHARCSILLVYFPTPVRDTPWTRFKWQVGHWLRKVLLVPQFASGFYGIEQVGGRTVRRLRPQARLRIPVPRGVPHLELSLELGTLAAEEQITFHVGNRQVDTACVGTDLRPVRLAVDGLDGRALELEIRCTHDGQVVLGEVVVHHPRHWLYREWFQRRFPELGQRLLNLYPTLRLDHLDTYDLLCANSRYTQRWIHRYWGRDSVVFYPPVDVEAFTPLPKRRQILSVGRFFTTGHNKKHLEMVRAFRRLVDEGLTGWELHLAGGVTPGALNVAYVERLRREAVGYPIHIHTNIPFQALRRLYGESAIYWHAAGYGEDPERYPLRYEHFGLTTVEAMAAECVPVVIYGGGQPEIVTHGVDGFLWRSLDEWLTYTHHLIANDGLRARMAAAARRRARAFSWQAFEERLDWILKIGE